MTAIKADSGTILEVPGNSLRKADLRGANLAWAIFRRADASGADFSDAYLLGANFRKANVERAKFRKAYLHMADFRGANLTGARFDGADVHGADFRGAVGCLVIEGSRHRILAIRGGRVQIGGINLSIAQWLRRYRKLLYTEYDYSLEQVTEYGRHLEKVRKWIEAR